MKKELEAAKELAVRAGAILLQYYDRPPSVKWKGLNDPVTDADQAAGDFLTAELRQRFPGDAVVCEENADDSSRLSQIRVWMVDPMDGTKEFIAHCDEFAVMIGLAVDGVAQVGVVYQPVTATLYYASAGTGAFSFQNGRDAQLHVSGESNPSLLTMAVSRSHPSRRVDRIRERLGVERTVSSGSMGLKVGLICENRAHLYVNTSSHTFQWDTCAPEAILFEAGGRMTDLSNQPLIYNRPDLRNAHGVIVSNGPLHERIAKVALSVIGEGI